ncbi:MAG: hypothetical protein U0Q15_02360 [Kineosporiaceae bacterium]
MFAESDIRDAHTAHLRATYDADARKQLRAQYEAEDYVELPSFAPDGLQAQALAELETLFAENARRRDLLMAATGNTPRRYSNLDRDALAAGSTIVPAVYLNPGLIELLQDITGEDVHPVPYVPEEFIASRLHEPGDVHGYHWDDYTWALIWVFKMPPVELGGSLEYVKRVPWNREDPQIDELVAKGPLERRHPPVGGAYLLKADTALHRVAPLNAPSERMIVCYSYATAHDLTQPISHETMELLYPESHQRHNA